MTFTFTALLCLGLTLGLRTPVLAGTLPKPLLRAQPDSVVSHDSQVTLLCEGTTGAKEYHLYKEGISNPWRTVMPQKPGNKAEFSITKIHLDHAGKYRCHYQTLDEMSEYSDLLELVVTGVYSKPSLSAQPSPVMISGENVTLQCVSDQHYHRFILTEEGPQKLSWTLDSQYNTYTRQFQALFSVGPVTANQRWIFRCYSSVLYRPQVWSVPSDALEIHISGLSKKPSLLNLQEHILHPGKSLTLQCHSDIHYDRFALHKVGGADLTQHYAQHTQTGFSMANFTLGSVSQSTGGQYRCYGAHNLSSELSASSDPLDIMITGMLRVTPFLSAHPNSTVHSGDDLTMLCSSMDTVDTLLLSKGGSSHTPLRLRSVSKDGQFQAEFSMRAVNSDLSGTYRCYGSLNSSPYLLSHASDPVDLIVSVSQTQDHKLENIIRLGMSALILTVLGILLFEAWHSQKQTQQAAGG